MKKKKSDKSKLVKKYLEHKNWESYKEALGTNQRGTGMYILYNDNEVYYIGLSKRSLRGRLRKHATKDRHKGKWNNFSFYQIGRKKYIKDIE
ncbi:MAG: GIY-YIG nuclease family protein, partial [Nitrospinota bacterium]